MSEDNLQLRLDELEALSSIYGESQVRPAADGDAVEVDVEESGLKVTLSVFYAQRIPFIRPSYLRGIIYCKKTH